MLKRSVTKLTLAQRHEIGKKVAEIRRCHACDFSTLTTKWINVIIPILPTQTNNLSKFCSSNFLTCLIHQISSDFATVKILRYTVTLKMPNVVGENHSRITNYTVFVAVSSHFTTHSSCTNIYVCRYSGHWTRSLLRGSISPPSTGWWATASTSEYWMSSMIRTTPSSSPSGLRWIHTFEDDEH